MPFAPAPAPSIALEGERPVVPELHRPCPDDMVTLPTFCIDRYEAPNERGAVPYTFRTADDGEAWCTERGKRLCTEAEWVRACEGASGRAYPYGDRYEPQACNDSKLWKSPDWTLMQTYPSPAAVEEAKRLLQAEASGSRDRCVSEEGVHDLTGNVAEWVVRSYPNPTNYGHLLKGCFWVGCKRSPHPSCDYQNFAHPGAFRTYEAGFRCCSARGETDR